MTTEKQLAIRDLLLQLQDKLTVLQHLAPQVAADIGLDDLPEVVLTIDVASALAQADEIQEDNANLSGKGNLLKTGEAENKAQADYLSSKNFLHLFYPDFYPNPLFT